MISDSTGNNYDQLKYLAKKIQFVSIYNPYSFFTSPQMASQKELKFVKLKNEEYSKLPFMDLLCQKKFNPLNSSQTVFQGNLPKYLNSKGIIHLYGHGNFKINSELGSINLELPYQTNNQVSSISKIKENQEVNNSLIVLNNCFSGFNVNISSREFDRGIYLSLLNKGALNVIVSPAKTDDESSSKIFNSFYQNIAKGETTEDALYHAQLYYLKTNQGSLAHPKFWSPYRLISNYRFPIYTTNNKENRTMYFLYSTIVFFVISGIIVLYVRKRNF
ncbi:MAG: CHAT domain-containing protein, partial [Fluviicola sp.]|nr:CHAT domain-containing protein [Fluviicola sp.]